MKIKQQDEFSHHYKKYLKKIFEYQFEYAMFPIEEEQQETSDVDIPCFSEIEQLMKLHREQINEFPIAFIISDEAAAKHNPNKKQELWLLEVSHEVHSNKLVIPIISMNYYLRTKKKLKLESEFTRLDENEIVAILSHELVLNNAN